MKKYFYVLYIFSFLWILFHIPALGDIPERRHLSGKEAYALLNNKGVIFLDVSPMTEYERKHAAGAESFSYIRLSEFETTFPSQKLTYLIIGNKRDSAYNYLYKHNYRNIFIVGRSDDWDGNFNNTEDDWENYGLPVEESHIIKTEKGIFRASGYNLFQQKDTSWIHIAKFPIPTISLFGKYRQSHAYEIQGEDSTSALFSNILDLSYEIGCITFHDGKIWAGFSFYEGEGWEGFGGIGFFDLSTKAIGILRHPALVDCSVRSLSITDDKIYVATINNYEGGYALCNGLLEIDRETLSTSSHIPPTIHGEFDIQDIYLQQSLYYDKPIASMLRDKRFTTQEVPQLTGSGEKYAGNLNLETLMIATADSEVNSRMNSILQSHQCFDTLINLQFSNFDHSFDYYPNPEINYTVRITGIPNKNVQNNQFFSKVEISVQGLTDSKQPFTFLPTSKKDSSIECSDAKYLFIFKLITKNIVHHINMQIFKSAQIQIIIKEIR